MRVFTEYLPYLSKGWAPSVRRLCLLLVAGAMLGAQPVKAEDFGTDVTAILMPPIKDNAAHVPRPLVGARCRSLPADLFAAGRRQLAGRRPTGQPARRPPPARAMSWPTATSTPPSTRPDTSNCATGSPSMATCRRRRRSMRWPSAASPTGAAAPPAPTVTKVKFYGNPDSSREPTFFNWRAGLEAWRSGKMETAAGHFEKVATRKGGDAWSRAAGAFWAARSHLKAHQPEEVTKWLREAAKYPRTFYGQLSRRALGMDPGLHGTWPRGEDRRAPDPGDPRRRPRPGADPDRRERPRGKRDASAPAGQGRQGAWAGNPGGGASRPNLPSLSLRLGVQYREPLGPDPRSRDLSPAHLGAAERLPDRSRAAVRADAAGVGLQSRGEESRRAHPA